MSKSKRVPAQSLLLAALSGAVRRHLLARCEEVELVTAAVLCQPGDRIRHVFFPIDSSISLVTPTARDASLEVAVVGGEGMLGISLLLGVNVVPFQGIVQRAGRAWRMKAAVFLRELERSPPLRRQLNRYLYARLIQLAQATVCTRFHKVEGRLARSLLVTRDRARADEFHVTHELLAGRLGVRRVGITQGASSLQRRNLIRYSRGNISILDGLGLEAASCGCYAADKETYTRVMG